MTRAFQINGETLVRVRGGAHMSGVAIGTVSELGLASESIQVIPRFVHKDIKCDDFGPDIAADMMTQLADVTIRMQLIHYDRDVLDICMDESMGGGRGGVFIRNAGVLPPAGTILGGLKPLFASGNHFISLNLASPQLVYPWRFPAAYLTGQPLEIPLGSKSSIVVAEWRAIPYVVPPRVTTLSAASGTMSSVGEIQSSGALLWDRTPD